MTDHEDFQLLAARRISEPLSRDEDAELEEHLAGCPECRLIAAGMRRDDIRLRAELGQARVAPRVRERVMVEARGNHRFAVGRIAIVLAATLGLAAVGIPLLAGGFATDAPSPPANTNAPEPSRSRGTASAIASDPPSPSMPASISPAPTPDRYVAGAYTYGDPVARGDTVAGHFEEGTRPVGEWSRRIPASRQGESYGGPITCLVIRGGDAWLAGPATTATDGTKDRAALIYVHDGGLAGNGDRAILWLTNPGQTLATVEEWCERRFIPADPVPLTSGDVVVSDGQ